MTEDLRKYYDETDTSAELADAVLERPATGVEPMVTYALRLPQPVLGALRDEAERQGMSVSALMRGWLQERLGRAAVGRSQVVPVDDLLAFVAESARPATSR